MSAFYNFSVSVTLFGLKLISPISPRIRAWLKGRKNWREKLILSQSSTKKCIVWFHCASLGEYEQGKPVMQALKSSYPDISIFLTFFSPSGYEARKDSALADYVGYLPADTVANARDFVEIVKPQLAIFVKAEIWPNFLMALKEQHVPTFLISARFYPEHFIFKRKGSFIRKQLKKFDFLFVQDKVSQILLKKYNIESVLTGDTRFDQVSELLDNHTAYPIVESFISNSDVLVVGSCWEEDIDALLPFLNDKLNNVKIILAPHSISEGNVHGIASKLKTSFIRYSQANEKSLLSDKRVLIIDNIGMLAHIYRYATISYVGGAFKQGLHNILEPAVYGTPVVFGPETNGFPEAAEMIKEGGGFSISDKSELQDILKKLIEEVTFKREAGQKNKLYLENKKGATEKIMTNVRVILTRKFEQAA